MYSSELVKDKETSFPEPHQQQEEPQETQQNDFAFDQYINQPPNDTNLSEHPQPPQNTALQQPPNQNESELEFLKHHLATIETIAMNQIKQLQGQLENEKREKESLKSQLQELISQQTDKKRQNQQSSYQMMQILKEENKMLKQALKKQLQINKVLIKTSIQTQIQSSHKIEHPQNSQEANKQNISSNFNKPQEQIPEISLYKLALNDRPTIPHPTSHSKRVTLR